MCTCEDYIVIDFINPILLTKYCIHPIAIVQKHLVIRSFITANACTARGRVKAKAYSPRGGHEQERHPLTTCMHAPQSATRKTNRSRRTNDVSPSKHAVDDDDPRQTPCRPPPDPRQHAKAYLEFWLESWAPAAVRAPGCCAAAPSCAIPTSHCRLLRLRH
jgi:hypothetical protein